MYFKEKELTAMEKAYIEEMCEKIITEMHYNEGELDVVTLAKKLGFTVGISPLEENEDGFIIIDSKHDTIKKLTGIDTDKIVCINSQRDMDFKRFILAHEIAHYQLHYLNTEFQNKGFFAHRENIKGKDSNENDADFFAACLLMPKKIFKKKYEELKEKDLPLDSICILLSKYFNTPLLSVERRINEVVLE